MASSSVAAGQERGQQEEQAKVNATAIAVHVPAPVSPPESGGWGGTTQSQRFL